ACRPTRLRGHVAVPSARPGRRLQPALPPAAIKATIPGHSIVVSSAHARLARYGNTARYCAPFAWAWRYGPRPDTRRPIWGNSQTSMAHLAERSAPCDAPGLLSLGHRPESAFPRTAD